jgi:hypothetical protein
MNWRANIASSLHSILILTEEGHEYEPKYSTDEYSAL